MAYETTDRDFNAMLHQKLTNRESLLDIGSGPCVLLDTFPYAHIVALEIHRPYLINRATNASHIIPLNADAREMNKLFVPKSFSAVAFIDSIEHFTKHDAHLLLQKAEAIAKHHVIVYTPRGFFPQQYVDHFGLNGEKFQTHRSGWEPAELEELGYEVTIMKGMHDQRNPAFVHAFGLEHTPIDALLAIKYLG
ncbi:class I SAM-dependent methyltransferase [Paenibacillus sp. CF384]|uniref:class I SAM-dependent methyltransferase n=1 Tax=Paenibacillus sp. CF384 TaxID=1884382 RepID=UPI000899B6E9|nr:class I SAM-dependent methyltransferase [Paenibacillus sp. CF384]SDX65244.1 hypothetical protein SAMN05518855_10185 [Paenibacillus sp. CF384]